MGAILLRADGNAHIGVGHLMRCRALAEAASVQGIRASIASADDRTDVPVLRVNAASGTDKDAKATIGLARQCESSWIVVDGYQFGAGYQRALKDAGLSVLVMDDGGHSEHYSADVIVNANVHAHDDFYRSREPYTKLLLGTRYVFMRQEFLEFRRQRKARGSVKRVLVTLGGGDAPNATLAVLLALSKITKMDFEVVVAIGPENPHRESLEAFAAESALDVKLESGLNQMARLMAESDIAIAGAGSTSWELAYMGVPQLAVVIAENQRPVAEELERLGVVMRLGDTRDLKGEATAKKIAEVFGDDGIREQMRLRGTALVDGLGVRRVLAEMGLGEFSLRRARPDDCEHLYEWNNQADVRAVSFSTDPIPYESHRKWFAAKLSDPACRIYIALDRQGARMGQVRYEISGNEAEVAIVVDSRYRGKQYGALMIERATQIVRAEGAIEIVHAYIRGDNEKSSGAFRAAGFVDAGKVSIKGCEAAHYLYEKQNITAGI
ncbi:MAG: UDP-2,4-diacetamido-2,4,6-trideoxy-beta-L-altropyranose hydrolase [Candidatus Omnitrophota bacterium]|nr:UDP-2,4-diacetamido-2,4,6-trideoxy-beta-L-altropyranose hydrolase [Candidatus Omnitrophota bacterium]